MNRITTVVGSVAARLLHELLDVHAPADLGAEVAQAVQRVRDVLRREWRPVAPLDARADLDRELPGAGAVPVPRASQDTPGQRTRCSRRGARRGCRGRSDGWHRSHRDSRVHSRPTGPRGLPMPRSAFGSGPPSGGESGPSRARGTRARRRPRGQRPAEAAVYSVEARGLPQDGVRRHALRGTSLSRSDSLSGWYQLTLARPRLPRRGRWRNAVLRVAGSSSGRGLGRR